jgi:AcrR family transcriptional regulator
MPRTEEANQRIREAQQAKILDAARKLFARKGMATTMADIAIAAEISQGLAYRYFTNKEAIFKELVRQTTQTGLTTLQRITEMPGTPGQRLAMLISMIFTNNPERLEYYQLALQMVGDEAIPDDLHELLIQPGRAFQDILRQLITEGQATGEVAQGDPEQLVIAVMACFDGLSRLALRNSDHFKQHFPDAGIILRMLKS